MNGNRYTSLTATCPLYKYHDAVSVYCEGEDICRIVRLGHFDSGGRREYMRRYCQGTYSGCRICRALLQEKIEKAL